MFRRWRSRYSNWRAARRSRPRGSGGMMSKIFSSRNVKILTVLGAVAVIWLNWDELKSKVKGMTSKAPLALPKVG